MNHRFSPRALARFGRKKVRLGGLPRPLAWMAGFLGGQALGQEAPTPPPYPAAVDGHYLTFCAGEAIRFEHLFSPLREELARVEGEIQRLQAAPQSPAPDSLAQLTELLTQAETVLAERAVRARGIAQARKAAYRAGASRRLRRPVSLAEGPLPQQWLPLHRREDTEKGVL